MEFLFWVPGCLLTGKYRVKKTCGLSALYTEKKMNCLVIGWMLSWVTIKIVTCLTDVTQGKRYVDARQEQSLITTSWSSLRGKGIYQQFNYSRNTLGFMQDKKESAVCTVRFQAQLKSKEHGRGWAWFCESPTATNKSSHNSPEVSSVERVYKNESFGPNSFGVFAVSHLWIFRGFHRVINIEAVWYPR